MYPSFQSFTNFLFPILLTRISEFGGNLHKINIKQYYDAKLVLCILIDGNWELD